jgi:hypothetical protein
MKEEIFRFGKKKGLIGTMTSPEAGREDHELPAIILLNAGLIHRVGPYRLNVDLSRILAAKGFMSFRFDMARKGDSEKGDMLKTYMQLAEENIREAMDFLSGEMGVRDFVLIGFCSSADQIHPVSVSDQRVTGAVFLDGCGYRTGRFYLHYLNRYAGRALHAALEPGRLKMLIKNKFNRIRFEAGVSMEEDEYLSRRFATKEQARADIMQMMGRGVNLLYIYSGGVPEYYTYRSQFEDMFGLKIKEYKDKLQVEFFKDANHTYTFIEDRVKLINTIAAWMQSHYTDTKRSN